MTSIILIIRQGTETQVLYRDYPYFPDLWIFTGIASKELRSSEFLFSIPSTSSVNAASLSSCKKDESLYRVIKLE